ncbi:MAG: YafY family transcriptional regulator [Acidobacteria bacterium]|nr:YafY family transcriptional regulator [Acidobacteriota bacterium]
MRADRLISILLLLQIHRCLTANELARRLEVSERTIHRDMEALSSVGVPVTADRGAGGGWRLVGDYRTKLTGLHDTEIQSLFLNVPPQLLTDLGWAKTSEAAMTKLLAEVPPEARRDAEFARQRIHVDVTGWHRPEESVPMLPALQQAVWQDCKLRISYQRDPDCEAFERVVDPLGLVAKGSVWYLIAATEGEPRTYRVSRVLTAALLDEPSKRPADFDLAAHWQQSAEVFKTRLPRFDATLRVRQEALRRLHYAVRFARVEYTSEPDTDGWIKVKMRFQLEDEAAEFALSFGPHVEVMEPLTLREKVIRLAESVVEFYANLSLVGEPSHRE